MKMPAEKKIILSLLIALLFASCSKQKEIAHNPPPPPPSPSNKPPIANAGTDVMIVLPQDSAKLDGSASSDIDGNINGYLWTKISGPSSLNILNANAVQTQVTRLVQGVYQFELKVTDVGGLFSTDTVQVTVNASNANNSVSCDNRPVINARLVPIGSLSVPRIDLSSAATNNKILFAGGMTMGAYSSRVDIYDISTNTWSTAELSKPERQGMAVATVKNKILFAGGGDSDNGYVTSRVDIYNVSTNTWSTAELSKPREYLTATTLGDKVFFAGGGSYEPHLIASRVIDIYDNATNTWSTASLSEGRVNHSATVVGNKIYFAGGTSGYYTSLNVLKTIDIYDGATHSWSTSSLQEPRMAMASIAVANKIFWAGGFSAAGFTPSNKIEIKDVSTGISSLSCIIPKYNFDAVVKDEKIIFFTGNYSNDPLSGTHFDIYDTKTDQWSVGVLDRRINDATIISVNNTIYLAGGRDNGWGPYFNQVWKLEF